MASITLGNSLLAGMTPVTVQVLNRGEESFSHDLQEITEAVQADRAAGVSEARSLALAAQLLLAAEAARLARRDAADPRVLALAQGAQMALAQASWLAQQGAQAAVRVPMVQKTEALLHGRVTDAQAVAAGPVTVSLVDAAGKPVEGVAPVKADSAGYYALVVPAEVAAKLPADGRYAVTISNGSEVTPARMEAVPLAAGVAQLKDIQLGEEELVRLKLRPALDPLRSGPATPGSATEAPRSKAPDAGTPATEAPDAEAPTTKPRSTRPPGPPGPPPGRKPKE